MMIIADCQLPIVNCSLSPDKALLIDNWQSAIGNRQSAMLHLALLSVRFVGLYDHLHKLVAHHIFFTELNEVDSFDAGEYAFGLD